MEIAKLTALDHFKPTPEIAIELIRRLGRRITMLLPEQVELIQEKIDAARAQGGNANVLEVVELCLNYCAYTLKGVQSPNTKYKTWVKQQYVNRLNQLRIAGTKIPHSHGATLTYFIDDQDLSFPIRMMQLSPATKEPESLLL
jgi:hypothetical protein